MEAYDVDILKKMFWKDWGWVNQHNWVETGEAVIFTEYLVQV